MSHQGTAPFVSVCLFVVALAPSTGLAQTTGVREVSASRSLVSLQTRVRYTTMIVLPAEEEILDVVCGDRDFWVISLARPITSRTSSRPKKAPRPT